MKVYHLISLSVFAVCAVAAPVEEYEDFRNNNVEEENILGRLEEFNNRHVKVNRLKSMAFDRKEYFMFPVVIVDMHEEVKNLTKEDEQILKLIYRNLNTKILPALKKGHNDIVDSLNTIDDTANYYCKNTESKQNQITCQDLIQRKNRINTDRENRAALENKYSKISEDLARVNKEMNETLEYFKAFGLHIKHNGASYIAKANIAHLLYLLQQKKNGTGAKPWSDIGNLIEKPSEAETVSSTELNETESEEEANEDPINPSHDAGKIVTKEGKRPSNPTLIKE